MAIPIVPIIGLIGTVLDKLIPDKDAANKAKAELETLLATQELQIQLAQITVNAEEAKHSSKFIAGGRPFIIWVCGVAFAWAYVVQPFLMFFVFAFGTAEMVRQLALLPKLDLAMMMPPLFGLLGLGAYRTYEKRTGTEANR